MNAVIRASSDDEMFAMDPAARIVNVMSVDVEEYFHPTEVQKYVDISSWSALPSRVEQQALAILDLFDRSKTRATFFVVGWVAERHPRLVRRIAEAGHELGCHSFQHALVYDLTPGEFRADTERCQAAIADACGVLPRVYRAPTYSITAKSIWALEILVELGFTHDSSIYPIVHDRYGIPAFPRHASVVETPAGPIHEVPIATVKLLNGRVAPVGGGAYLRLFPYRYTAAGIRRINATESKPACMYFHPWEIDPEQPHLAEGFIARTRTYGGISTMFNKLERLVSDFPFSTISEVYGSAVPGRRAACA
jgi:polysaccharide deacetylase family protein (PEP-CTERM system associated)